MIFNIGSGFSSKLPVLDSAYPLDVNVDVGEDISFEVKIAEPGKPAEYTFQWYYDDAPVDGATESTYSRVSESGSHSVYCMVMNKAGAVKSRTATVGALRMYLFKDGNQYESVTGGWESSEWNNKGTAQVTTKLYVSSANASKLAIVGTSQKIDFTGFDVLHYTSPNGRGGKAYGGYLRVCTDKNHNSHVASVTINAAGNGTLDISAIDGEYYVCVYALGGGNGEGRCDVSDLYAE